MTEVIYRSNQPAAPSETAFLLECGHWVIRPCPIGDVDNWDVAPCVRCPSPVSQPIVYMVEIR